MPFDLIAAAREVIAIDTVSANGNLGLIPSLKNCADRVGLELQIFEEQAAGTTQANLLFRVPSGAPGGPPRPSVEAPLLLLTHTDTVAPGPADRWTETKPFEPLLVGDKLYGLGSADVKVDLLCKLLAAERIPRGSLRRGLFILGTYGEEIGLLGAKSFVQHGIVKPRFVVCGEPSQLTIIHAHKGYLVARVSLGQKSRAQSSVTGISTRNFSGKSAHSSTPHLGENAILKALREPLEGVVAIRGGQGANSVPAECAVELASDPTSPVGELLPLASARRLIARFAELVAALAPTRGDRFDPPQAVTNLGYIEGRDGALEMLLDARLLPGHRPDELATAFEEEVRALGGTVVFERANPAVYTDPASELCQAAVRVIRRLNLDATLHTKATNTEAAAFAGVAEAIVFGPGPSVGNAHCPNEHTLVPQLFQAIDWYEALIRELCC